MKRNTPLITLLTGAALGIILLVASMLATPKAPASSATPAPAYTVSSPPSSSSPAPAATAAAVPARADYAGEVRGGSASVAISIHGGQAIAYVCNGSGIEAWLKGTAADGQLIMTGKDRAQLRAAYNVKRAVGQAVADGIRYRFSAPAVHKPSGLYRSIAIVRGAKIKAGWIVLPDGTQVGSVESDPDSAAPSAARAPVLDAATGTAKDGSTVIVATPINGVTGTGF